METYKCFKKLSLNILIRFNVKCVQIIQKIANSRQYRVFEDDVSHSSYKVFLVNLLRPFFLNKIAVIYTIKKMHKLRTSIIDLTNMHTQNNVVSVTRRQHVKLNYSFCLLFMQRRLCALWHWIFDELLSTLQCKMQIFYCKCNRNVVNT